MAKKEPARPKRNNKPMSKADKVEQRLARSSASWESNRRRLKERYLTQQEIRERLKQMPPERRKRMKELLSKGARWAVVEGRPYTEEEEREMLNRLSPATPDVILELLHQR
ncbi:MAG: hypothetical protein NZT92_17750 [Abditibacteriales bacterium]|nr:hypothetical protein [Abditibacteriales bacterium]MDW8367830.1 hypothetical protein [Abditibacteriales bacterium]